ncbi:sensor histidine kinase [Sphingobacterium athyrii]|uniref:histidine kinase n=1 Tax=Sphingobacterium athyrii TaxID=2152717 RepID=A0A363NRG4_9SPHI|nr:HAMP domain-containing sensor histidine kinase [Sphingobacterium athyrii]PUV23358.1 histidine kinase [Sphingobacterium athyrii]
MGSRFKLLISLIVLIGTGITIVLGIWLYGSYTNRRDLFLSTAERSLFNAVQEVYQAENGNQRLDGPDNERNRLLNDVKSELLPFIPEAQLDQALQKIRSRQPRKEHTFRNDPDRKVKMYAKDRDNQNAIIPPFLFRDFEMNKSNLDLIDNKFRESLSNKGISVPYELSIVTIPREQVKDVRREYREKNLAWTRPMMVNPLKSEFLVIKFQEDWKYLLYSLSWQLLISLLLIGLLLGTFFYLMKTILNQNKMAELRKNFVDNMTHELKTPVSTVMAAVEAIQLYGVREDKEKMDRYLDISKRELEHLSGMIEKVLQMDIDASRGIVLQRSEFDLVAMVESVIEVAQLNKTKAVEVELFTDPKSILIRGDESHLKNVINNLLENAIKYAGQHVKVKVDIKGTKEHVQLRITDNGKGIAPEYHQQIFDMFFRVPAGNLHDVKGFGLGLAYVKQVVKRHEGKISVESELGKGSTFTIRLPY